MKLSDLNKLFFFLIIFLNLNSTFAEEEVDIWKKDSVNTLEEEDNKQDQKIQSPLINKNKISTNSIIQEQTSPENNDTLLYGIWDPDTYNFELSGFDIPELIIAKSPI